MSDKVKELMNFFQKEISSHIPKHSSYSVPEQLKRMQSFFSPGNCFMFILNFHNLKMEYASEGTRKVLGIEPEEFTTERMLKMITPAEMELMNKKEQVVTDFLFNHAPGEEMKLYKAVYLLNIKDAHGRPKQILHQVTVLTVSETGKMEHTLGVYTDVTDWKIPPNKNLSLIHLKGGPSYYNLNPESGKFEPTTSLKTDTSISEILTSKEKEILALLTKGLTGKEIAEELNISFHTVRTHRNNILKKTSCANTTELISRNIMEGNFNESPAF